MSVANIKPYSEANFRNAHMTIEQLSDRLNKYAFTRVSQSNRDSTYTAIADMRIKTEGAKFEVRSEFSHPTMHSAMAELLDRVENAVKDLGR